MNKLCYYCRQRPGDERYPRYNVKKGTNEAEHVGYACRICAVKLLKRAKRNGNIVQPLK